MCETPYSDLISLFCPEQSSIVLLRFQNMVWHRKRGGRKCICYNLCIMHLDGVEINCIANGDGVWSMIHAFSFNPTNSFLDSS